MFLVFLYEEFVELDYYLGFFLVDQEVFGLIKDDNIFFDLELEQIFYFLIRFIWIK